MEQANATGSAGKKQQRIQQSLIKFLKSIGFEIKEEERELEVVIITDK